MSAASGVTPFRPLRRGHSLNSLALTRRISGMRWSMLSPVSSLAPAAGGHTCEICRELPGMDHGETDDLASRGVLHETGTRHNQPR